MRNKKVVLTPTMNYSFNNLYLTRKCGQMEEHNKMMNKIGI